MTLSETWEIRKKRNGQSYTLSICPDNKDQPFTYIDPEGLITEFSYEDIDFLGKALPVALEKLSNMKKKKQNLPANAGKPWTDDQDQQLTSLWNERKGPDEISKIFERKKGSIISRLVKNKLVENSYIAEERDEQRT